MIKLYKRVGDDLHYDEAWVHEGQLTRHFGICGDNGKVEKIDLPPDADEDEAMEKALAPARAAGYEEVDEDDMVYLLVEYEIEGSFGSAADLNKRHELEDRLNGTLGWAGVGHVDGGSSGSGTMETCCVVVDAAIATKVIEADLAGTPFADYSRIYVESGE